jgi:hypothetical protein
MNPVSVNSLEGYSSIRLGLGTRNSVLEGTVSPHAISANFLRSTSRGSHRGRLQEFH